MIGSRTFTRWAMTLMCLLLAGSVWSADRALLVGVTSYDNLPKNYWLIGPGQDVYMFRQTLLDRFGYTPDGILILSDKEAEEKGEAHLPTKARIIAALDDLAKTATKEDRIVILMGGHGTRAPRKAEAGDSNPHALSGLFLPRDITSWDEEIEDVPGAIKDVELAAKLKAILDTGAHVWLIMDSCHSGGMARDKARAFGDPSEVARDLSTDVLGIPATAMEEALKREATVTEGSRGGGDSATSGFESAIDMENLAATYACRVIEQTYERNFPPNEGKFGILSYTICRVLNSTPEPLTYAELTRRVNLEYDAMGRNNRPVALVEGKAQDHFVLDASKTRESRIRIQFDDDELMMVDVGDLHGMTPGTILAVYPPAGQPDADTVQGHVQIVETQAARSYVVACEYDKVPLRETFAKESLCQIVYREFGIAPIQVGIAADVQQTEPAFRAALMDNVAHGRLYELVEGETYPWLLSYVERETRPRTIALVNTATGREYLPPLGTADVVAWVIESLSAVAQVQGLLQVAAASSGDAELKVDVELVLNPKTRRDPRAAETPLDQSQDIQLYLRDRVGLRITNNSSFAVDVCVLFVDSNYKIQQVYPIEGTGESNHLLPKEMRMTAAGTISADSDGQERFVVVALPGDSTNPANLKMLESDGFTLDQDLAMRAKLNGVTKALWYNKARSTDEGARGYSPDEADMIYSIHNITFSTQRKLRPREAKPATPQRD